jgi:gliding motility-associated-like protein
MRDSNGDTVVPNIVYVDASASAGGNGNSWATAFNKLQDGVAAANALASGGCNQQNISIHIAEGIYYPDEGVSQTDNDPNAYFSINQINLYGGFPSGGGDINNRNPLANRTILSGDIEQDDASSIIRDISHIQGTNSNKLFESGRSIVDGITFTAGYSNDSSPINFNGGTVNRCEITGNSGYGIGAVDISFSNDTGFYITNAVFANNEARRRFTVGYGGAISARIPDFVEEQQVLHVYNSTFHNNTAAVGGSHFQLDNCQMELVNSIVTGGNDVPYIDFQHGASATISYTLMDRSSAGIADHVLIDDPMYSNAANGDFQLKKQSPALNYGEINITGIGTVDFEGKSRNQGCGIDLGAFENEQTERIVYVNPLASGISLGNSWDNAYKTIHEALSCTQGASEIRVAEGSYTVSINGSRNQHITITMGVKLVGGYYRSETGQWLNDYEAHPSIITGDLNLSGNPDEGDSYTLLEILGDDVTIDGFIFENAFANGTGILPYDNIAAGIYNSGTNLTVQNCIFRKLKSTGEGTAYFHQSGNASFYNCLFERNESNITGSSFSVQNGVVSSVNCTFANNLDGGTSNGATIFVNKGNPAFKNCILYGNTKNVHSLNLPGSIECSASGSGTPSCIDIGNTSFQNTLYQLPFQSNFVLDNGNNIGVEAGNAGTIFVNLANHDYTLTETSEAVNRGLNDELPSTLQLDLAKNKRLNEAVIDIGAYELTDIRCNNAEIIHVNANAPDGGDGLSWETAFNDLQDALALQCIGMEIWVAQGVYKTSNANEESASFVLPENTILYGGFQGYELELSERDYAQYPTVLSGDLDDSDSANMGDGHTILTIISDNIILDGFVLEYAYADDDSTIEGRMGAGIFSNRSANFNINNCIFRHLIAEGNGSNGIGGAIIIFDATSELTITNGLFHDNTASAYGGALSVESGASLNLINCTLANNDAENNGGGVNTNNNPITIVNTIFASNTSNSGFDNIEISTPTFSHSYLQGQRPSGTGNIDGTTVTDPLFTDVANNDYTLQSSSPLIDKGDNTVVDFDSDLAGEDRKVDFLETATPRIDLGAYELPVAPTIFEAILCNAAKPSYTFCYENDLKYRVALKSISGTQLSLRFAQGAIETNDVINIYDSSDRTNRIWSSNGLPSSFHMVYNFSILDNISVVSPTGVMVVEIISNDRYSCEESSFNALFSPITFEVGCCETTSRTLFVNSGAPSGGNGLSWGTAFNSLQDAIANVSYCASDEIWVAAGTYKPGNLQTDSFKINFDSGVTILGGFNGTEANANERNWATNPTILSGDMDNSNTANIGDSHTIMSVLGNNVTIDGFIFEYAFADGLENTPTAIGRAGGGLYVQGSNNLAVNNCIFRNLIAEGNGNDGIGGAVIKFGSEIVTLTNCLFHDNQASADGGALSSQGGTLNIINCTFAENNSLGSGGAIHNHDTTSNIMNSIFAGNNATTSNPNINANSGSLTINYSYLQNEDRSGEGIGNIDGVTITDPLFTDMANSDYTLQSTSPLIDVGDNASNTGDRDLLGNDRIVNTIIDLGAYEFGNTPPNAVCKDITIYLDANGRATITAGEVDNGSTDTEGDVILSLDITDFDCDNLGENTVIFTVTDANGATATCTTIVTIADNLAPIPDVATLSDIRVQCEAATLEPPTAIDNCGGTITASHDATLPIRASCTIIWTYTDASGNDSTQEQRVIIEDTEAPIPNMAMLSDITAQCEATTLEPPTATDNCGGTITASHDATLPIRASTTIVWTYTDASGNGSTQQQRVIIEDTEAPIPNMATLSDIRVQCEATTLEPPTATDNCGGTITASHNATLPIRASSTIIWTYTDASGNGSTQEQRVIIEDTEAPIPDAPSLPDILEQCGVAALTPPTATDNCSGSIVTTHNAVLPITANTTIVWTYTDVSGNESFQMQDVLISGNCEDGGTIGTKIKISKVVTPNGDGINDYFVVEGIDVTEGKNISLVVFDRWGNIVYKSDNYQNDWDAGTANKSIQGSNGKVPSGTYFYIISHENNAPIKGTLYVGTK